MKNLIVLLFVLIITGCSPGEDEGVTNSNNINNSNNTNINNVNNSNNVDVCQDVVCGAGQCLNLNGVPQCACDEGYHPEDLKCIHDVQVDPCQDVQCGDNATCNEGICICDDGFEGDPDVECTAIQTEEMRIRAELVEIATAELGYCEGQDDRPYMQYQPGYWCYDFVAWVYEQSSKSLPTPISLPQYQVGSLPAGWRPEPGDLIKYTIQHYGMVASVSADGLTMTTIEGNVNYCVMQRSTTDQSVEYYGSLDSVFAK